MILRAMDNWRSEKVKRTGKMGKKIEKKQRQTALTGTNRMLKIRQ